MNQIPNFLKEIFSESNLDEINNWWQNISKEKQGQIKKIYEESSLKSEIYIEFCASIIGEEPIPDSDEVFVEELFGLYEYLVNHEMPVYVYPKTVVGICREHPKARENIKNGILNHCFECPINSKHCPMENLLVYSNKKSIRFFLRISNSQKCKP